MELCASTTDFFGNVLKEFCELRQYKCKGKWVAAAKSTGQSQAKADRHNDEACALYESLAEFLLDTGGLAAESAQSQLISALDDLWLLSERSNVNPYFALDFDDLLLLARDLTQTLHGDAKERRKVTIHYGER